MTTIGWNPNDEHARLLSNGLDLIACKRIEQALREHGDRLLDRLLTDAEKKYVAGKRNPVPHLAGRFAAKEAVFKAIGTGWRGGICWTDVEILNDAAGQPTCKLTGQVAHVAAKLGIERMLIPTGNSKDLPEVPKEALKGIEIITVDNMDQVLEHAFAEPVMKRATSDETQSGEQASEVYAH